MAGCGHTGHWPGIGRPVFDKNLEYAPRHPKEPPMGPEGPKGTPKTPKWTPKGSQMDPKGDQMDSKGIQMDPNGSQMDPKGSQMELKVAPKEAKDTTRKPRGQDIYSQTPDQPPKRPTSIFWTLFNIWSLVLYFCVLVLYFVALSCIFGPCLVLLGFV